MESLAAKFLCDKRYPKYQRHASTMLCLDVMLYNLISEDFALTLRARVVF